MTINEDIIAGAPGLHRAKLAAIRTQSWLAGGQSLSGERVVAYYCKIRERNLFGITKGRRWDRATAILKREGLITFVKGHGWRCTDEINV